MGDRETQPKVPLTVWALTLVAASGLVAQFLAAEGAFALIGRGRAYSVAAAFLIESAVVVDALVLARSRNWLALIGLVVALAVSGIYNYTLASMSAADLGQVQLVALAIGPLVALAPVGLALGEEWYRYELRVAEWEAEQLSLEIQAQRKLDIEQVSQRKAQEDEHLWQRRLQYDQAQADIKRADDEQAARLKEKRLAARRQERREVKVSGQGGDKDDRTVTGQVSGSDRTWPDKAAFLADDDRPVLTDVELARLTGRSERTARRWLAAAGSNGREADG